MVKRTFDIVASGLALIMLFPVLIVCLLLVTITSSGGAFFIQKRVGRNGRDFDMLKFRTMRVGSEAKGQITVGGKDPRITPFGYFLRKTKLDELPQLINVLKGDMSIVGPRPEVPKYVALYTTEQRKVLTVRPGLSSLASIAYINENEILGRSADPEKTYIEEVMPAKLKMDLHYVEQQSFGLDLNVIFRTLGKLFG